MALRIKRTPRRSIRTYTPSTRSVTTNRTRVGKGSYSTTRTENVTPSTSETSQSGGSPYPVYEGASSTHAGIAMLMATGLFLFATWKDVGSPLINSAANKTPYAGMPVKSILGGVLFIVVIGVIASTSTTGSDIMIWMLLAMWLLFIMFNGSGSLQGLLGSISPNTNTNSNTSQANGTSNLPPGFLINVSNPGQTNTQGG